MTNGLRLLGAPVRDMSGGTHELPPGQATHLAATLALRGDWVARDELVSLFWPDMEPSRGRHNLAQLVYAVRRTPWGSDVETDPARLRWQVSTDVTAFRDAAANGAWGTAAAVYRGHLLSGIPEAASDLLAGWLRSEQDDLRETWRLVLLRQAEEVAAQDQWVLCASLLRRLLADDGLVEEAVHGLMRAEAMSGRREAALREYDEFRQMLSTGLGLEPLETTTALAVAIRDGMFTEHLANTETSLAPVGVRPTGTTDDDTPAVRPGSVRGLGADPSPFVGRSLELAELHALAKHDEHPAITIHGPGGIGKTRLARQFARERAGHHEGGAAWVQLATATSEADVVEHVARALGLAVEGDAGSLAQALVGRDILIVLDQAEHLPELPGLVQAMLDASTSLRVLTTSRAALDLTDEAVVPLLGLAVPSRDDAEHPEAYDAVGLLLRAGRRARPDLQPLGPERAALVALTRLLAGNPLGLELAASWLRLLEPSELLEEVCRDLDVLTASDPTADPAHSSLRAVYESSWSLLRDDEREAARRLAVFRGGFTRQAAADVADVSLAKLLALANRSILYRDGGARFAMHPVVQHFSEIKLSQLPETAAKLEARHSDYFLALAQDTDSRMSTPEQPSALTHMSDEGPNVNAALERAIAGAQAERAYELVLASTRFWRWRGRSREGLAWLERIEAVSGQHEPTVLSVQADIAQSGMLDSIGRYDKAESVLTAAMAAAERLGEQSLLARGRRDLAVLAWRRGDLGRARQLLSEACAAYKELGLDAELAGTLGNLGNVMRDAGQLESAHAHFDEALELVRRIGHVWEIANVRNNKAIAYAYERDLEAARREFETALALQRSIANKPGMAMSLTNLGVVSMDLGETERAAQLYREALSICEETGDVLGVAHVHQNLGAVALMAGHTDEAYERFAAALKIRRELGARAMVAQSVSSFMALAVARGDFERALVLTGATDAIVHAVGAPLTPPQQAAHDEGVERAKAHVEADRADELTSRGAALSEQEAVEYALGVRALPGF